MFICFFTLSSLDGHFEVYDKTTTHHSYGMAYYKPIKIIKYIIFDHTVIELHLKIIFPKNDQGHPWLRNKSWLSACLQYIGDMY